jgi:hypothetical protein
MSTEDLTEMFPVLSGNVKFLVKVEWCSLTPC